MKRDYLGLLKNTLIFSIGTFSSSIITFLMLPIFTRVLTKDEYGQLDILLVSISLLFPILTFGIANSVFRFTIESKCDKKRKMVISSSLFVIVITLIFLVFLSLPLTMFFSIFHKYYIYFLVIFELQLFASILKEFIRAVDKIKLFALNDIIYALTFAFFGIINVAVLRKGISGYLSAIFIALTFSIAFLFTTGRLYRYIDFGSIDFSFLKKMIFYSLPLVPNGLSWWVMVSSDRYLLLYFIGYDAVGIYSVSNKIPSLVLIFNSLFYKAWQITSINIYQNKYMNRFYTNIFTYFYILMFGLVIILSLFIKPFLMLFLGTEFKTVWKYIPFLLLGVVFQSFSGFYGIGYLASKETSKALKTTIYGSLTNIIVNIMLIPVMGIHAAAISTFLGFFVMWIVRIRETKRYFQIEIRIQKFMFLFLLTLSALLLLYVREPLSFILQSICLLVFLIVAFNDLARLFHFLYHLIRRR